MSEEVPSEKTKKDEQKIQTAVVGYFDNGSHAEYGFVQIRLLFPWQQWEASEVCQRLRLPYIC